MLYLCDISSHKAGFNVAKAASEGYSAAIAKASQGTWYQDPCFDGFAQQAINAGLIPGAYHWLENGQGGLQAELFYHDVGEHGGPQGWLCACDCEDDADWATLTAFFGRWKELASGHPLILYSGNWWWESRGWNGAGLTPYLWDSRYVSGSGYGSQLYELVPDSWWTPRYGGWSETSILQYSSNATVAGSTPIDVDAFLGTREELLKLTRRMSDMEQTDKLIKGPSPWRTVGDQLADTQELRNWLVGETVPTDYTPSSASPLSVMLEAATTTLSGGPLTNEQLQYLADRVAPLVADRVAATIGESMRQLINALSAAGNDLAKLGQQNG